MNYREKAKEDFTPEELEDFEERAAILEFDGGYSKEDSEKKSYFMVLRDRK